MVGIIGHRAFNGRLVDMKRYNAIAIIIFLIVLLAGCGNENEVASPEQAPIEETIVEEQTTEEVAPEPQPSEVVIPEEKKEAEKPAEEKPKVEKKVEEKPALAEEVKEKPAVVPETAVLPEFPFADEKLVYRIKWNKLPIGTATFICAEEKKNGREVYHFTVFTNPIGMIAKLGLGFYKLEAWADKKTMTPIRYQDSLQNWPRKSVGTAIYDTKNHTVEWTVVKYKKVSFALMIPRQNKYHRRYMMPSQHFIF
jgi:predicted small lipoprotein YifL